MPLTLLGDRDCCDLQLTVSREINQIPMSFYCHKPVGVESWDREFEELGDAEDLDGAQNHPRKSLTLHAEILNTERAWWFTALATGNGPNGHLARRCSRRTR